MLLVLVVLPLAHREAVTLIQRRRRQALLVVRLEALLQAEEDSGLADRAGHRAVAGACVP